MRWAEKGDWESQPETGVGEETLRRVGRASVEVPEGIVRCFLPTPSSPHLSPRLPRRETDLILHLPLSCSHLPPSSHRPFSLPAPHRRPCTRVSSSFTSRSASPQLTRAKASTSRRPKQWRSGRSCSRGSMSVSAVKIREGFVFALLLFPSLSLLERMLTFFVRRRTGYLLPTPRHPHGPILRSRRCPSSIPHPRRPIFDRNLRDC